MILMTPPTHAPAIGAAGSKWHSGLALSYIGFHTDIFRFGRIAELDLRTCLALPLLEPFEA